MALLFSGKFLFFSANWFCMNKVVRCKNDVISSNVHSVHYWCMRISQLWISQSVQWNAAKCQIPAMFELIYTQQWLDNIIWNIYQLTVPAANIFMILFGLVGNFILMRSDQWIMTIQWFIDLLNGDLNLHRYLILLCFYLLKTHKISVSIIKALFPHNLIQFIIDIHRPSE